VDDLADLICATGSGCYLFKFDLSRAYRQLPIDPCYYILLGIRWRDQFFVDTRLPFGLASAAMACQRTTSAVVHMYNQMGYPLLNYLDDFASAGLIFSKTVTAFYEFRQLLSELGLHESVEKAGFPCKKMIFLGVLYNTESMTMEVTPDRLHQIREELSRWENKVTATKREIQQLVGKLQFVAKCVKPGRLFIARMLETLWAIGGNGGSIRLSSEFKADVYWWQKFLHMYNGVSVLSKSQFLQPGQTFQTDACLSSCGGVCEGEAFSTQFPAFIADSQLDINSLELLTVVVASKLWGHKWAGLRILVQCDNEVSTMVINFGRSRSQFLNLCARELLFVAAQNDFDIRAAHIAGSTNTLADSLSRCRLDLAFRDRPDLKMINCAQGLFQFQHDW
jgi:hypothetical protein